MSSGEPTGLGEVQVDLVRDEILTTSSKINVRVPADADPGYVLRAVGVPGVDGRVRLAEAGGRFTWEPIGEIPPGRHSFVVEALADAHFRRISERVAIPFQVVATRAEIPGRLRIESLVRIRLLPDGFERLDTAAPPGGEYIDVFKTADRQTGAPGSLGFDQEGRAVVDAERNLKERRQRLAARAGKLHPVLEVARLRALDTNERLLVDAWLDIDTEQPSAEDRPLNEAEVERAIIRAAEKRGRMRERARQIAASLGGNVEVLHVDELAPVLTLRVPAAGLPALADRNEIAALFLHEEVGLDDLQVSIAIAASDAVHATGRTGTGVRVAVWENGPTSEANLVIAGRFRQPHDIPPPPTSLHSQNVHAIICNRAGGAATGHAPGCSLFSANDKARAALTWAVATQNCTVINQSFHRLSEAGSGVLSADDLYADWLARQWPYPLIVQAAGNFYEGDEDLVQPPSAEFVNHKGYNTLTVGNHTDDAASIDAYSTFRNPTTTFGDRELPDIAANGTSVTADSLTMTGTSQAAPAVAGVAVLIQEAAPMLQHWPEGCRAILFASASRNVSSGTWWQDVQSRADARDGAGAVNAREACAVALSKSGRDAPPTQRGWDVGFLTLADFDGAKQSVFAYQLSVPNLVPECRKVKVALAWASTVGLVGLSFSSHLTVDLDLKVFDANGNLVGYSSSWENSYEIAEFVGAPGATYTIRIYLSSGTDSTYYGIAWTVTGGLPPVLA